LKELLSERIKVDLHMLNQNLVLISRLNLFEQAELLPKGQFWSSLLVSSGGRGINHNNLLSLFIRCKVVFLLRELFDPFVENIGICTFHKGFRNQTLVCSSIAEVGLEFEITKSSKASH